MDVQENILQNFHTDKPDFLGKQSVHFPKMIIEFCNVKDT